MGTPAGGNVFLDLGSSPDEAEALQKKSRQIIEQTIAVRRSICDAIGRWIIRSELTDAQACGELGICSDVLGAIKAQRVDELSTDRLIQLAGMADLKVESKVFKLDQ